MSFVKKPPLQNCPFQAMALFQLTPRKVTGDDAAQDAWHFRINSNLLLSGLAKGSTQSL
jgi:hypothetical protein